MATRFLMPFGTGRGPAGGDPLLELHREMNRLFDDVFRGAGGSGAAQQGGMVSAPRIEVREDDSEICVAAELPGVTQADLDLRLEGDVLTIAGEKKNQNEQKQQSYHVMERSYGRFQRVLQLPFSPDPEQVRASFEHGVLTIRVPKQAQQQRSRRIEIQGGSSQPQAQVGQQAGGQQGGGRPAGSGQAAKSAGAPGSPSAAGAGAGAGAGSGQQDPRSAGSV